MDEMEGGGGGGVDRSTGAFTFANVQYFLMCCSHPLDPGSLPRCPTGLVLYCSPPLLFLVVS